MAPKIKLHNISRHRIRDRAWNAVLIAESHNIPWIPCDGMQLGMNGGILFL
jgi:hypothetical protein